MDTLDLQRQLSNVLEGTNFDFLGKPQVGKVRDSYVQGDQRILVTTDRLSCFDRVITSIPYKGQVLNQVASYWFRASKGIIANHVVAEPDPNVMVVRECEVLPVEVIVRAYITGSAWRSYSKGEAVSGVQLPDGLRASEKLAEPVLTPTTKASGDEGHDEPISEADIVSSGLVEARVWEQVREVAFALFALGSKAAETQGLLLVDTKYEFGLLDGKLILVDEIHTSDSSRYWKSATYLKRFESGLAPEMLDKEPTRQWLLERGYQGDGPIPQITDDHRVSIAARYIELYEQLTGETFVAEVGPVAPRVAENLKGYLNSTAKS